MATAKHNTPLMALLRACESEREREQFAELAGTTVNYLYALAGCHRGQPRAALAMGIEDASRLFHDRTAGRIPVVGMREIATMCAIRGFDSES